MKKMIIALLILTMTFSLCACKKTPDATNTTPDTQVTTESTEETTEATEPAVSVDQQPMTSISLPVIKESEKADDGTEIFHITYQNISLTMPESEVADKIILDFLNRTDLHEDTAWIRDAAVSMHKEGIGSLPLWSRITYNPMRVDQTVISLYGSYAAFTGGAHGSFSCKSVTYDLLTGEPLSMGQIITEDATAETLTALVCAALKPQAGEGNLFEDYEATVKQLLQKNIQSYADWYLSTDGLCFYFSPYEIGPFASGDIVAQIPYSELTGILKDEYFPAERDIVNGNAKVVAFEEAVLEDFTQFAEIVLNEGGQKMLVYTDSALYDIRLETGNMSTDGTRFIPEYTVLGAGSLTPGDALTIEASFEEESFALRLTYTAGGETFSEIIQGIE